MRFRYTKLCNSRTNLVGVFGALGFATQITGQVFGLLDYGEASSLDLVSVCVQLQVSQHHDGGEQQSGRVGQILAGDIGSGSMDLENSNCVLFLFVYDILEEKKNDYSEQYIFTNDINHY